MPNGIRPKLRQGIWYAVGTFDGQRIRKSLGARDEATAREQCAIFEARLWKRHSYGEEAVRTFEEAALSYLEQGGEGRFLPPVMKHFRGVVLAKIKPGDVREMAIKLYPKAAAATRNRQAIVPASAVINHGHDRGWGPAIKVKPFDVPKSRKHKPVDDEWMAAFRAQCAADSLPHLWALVLFMNRTAARVSEAIRVTPEALDLGSRIVVLGKTKTGENRIRHLTTELVVCLAGLSMRAREPVFRYTDPKAVNRRIKAVCARAGIGYRPTHSAGRHSFGTNAIAAGIDVKTAMEAGDWRSANLFVGTYVHANEAGRSVAAAFDRETDPVGTELAQSTSGKRYRFGKKG